MRIRFCASEIRMCEDMMKFLVVGLGSMGRRRIRLLKRIMSEQIIIYGVDENPERCLACQKEYGINIFADCKTAMAQVSFDAGLVCTVPLAHADIISELLQNGLHVFTEINLVDDGYTKNMQLAKDNGVQLFLSSTPMYRKEMQYIKEQVQARQGRVQYNYHVGQYLPDWHPWDPLQEFFISKKRTNGCREIFAIELPWMIDTFGQVTEVKVIKQKLSELPIDYDDSYLVMLKHASGAAGTFSVNVVDRMAERDLKIFGENIFLKWNGTPDSLYQQDLQAGKLRQCQLYEHADVEHYAGYSDNIIENAYAAELEDFFAVIAGKSEGRYSFSKDIEILQLIDKIEA